MKHKNFNQVYAYAYLLVRKSDNKKYVGVRYANVKKNLTPDQDFGRVYFTSGKLSKEFKKNPENFKFRLVHTFDDIEEMFDWEFKVVKRVYKRGNWANNGCPSHYRDNPEIGKLISEGKNRVKSNGMTSIQEGAETLRHFIWNTEEGKVFRENSSKNVKKFWESVTPEQLSLMTEKRLSKIDYKEIRSKAEKTFSITDENGMTGHQKRGLKSRNTRKEKGIDSLSASKRNAVYNKKLGEMSEEEFENFCKDKPKRVISGAKTRRLRYLSDIK